MARSFGLDQADSLEGLWWRPSTPDQQAAGTLSFDPDTGSRLRLIGALGEIVGSLRNMLGGGQSETLHGFTRDGREVTLLGAVQGAGQINMPGLFSEEYVPLWVLIGGHFDGRDQAVFTRSFAAFDGLPEWLARPAFSQSEEGQGLQIGAKREPAWSLGRHHDFEILADMTLHANGTQWTHREVRVNQSLGVRPDKPGSLDWHMDQLSRLNRLVALCTGQHLSFRRVWLEAGVKEIGPGVTVPREVEALVRIFDQSTIKVSADPPIYSARELLDAEPDALSKWFEVADSLQPVIDLFFTVLGGGLPSEAAYLLTIQAVEVHHRRTAPQALVDPELYASIRATLIDAVPANTPKAMREKLSGTLTYANEHSLAQRLKAMRSRLTDAFGPDPMGFDKATIRSAVETRNYYTHYSPALEASALKNANLYKLTEAFQPLLFTLLLAELGLPLEDIRRHLQRRRRFSHV
jgi:hypothetical protein